MSPPPASPATFLRNGWYTENHLQDFTAAREHGVIADSIGAGRIATALRKEFAEAAAVVLSTPGHEGQANELSGDVAWSFEEFATTAQELLGTSARYQALTSEAGRGVLDHPLRRLLAAHLTRLTTKSHAS
ncbi:hypothetical protein [Nonomuraea diastatica]|uniref:hypothetical protein n=1 Tax=Nonomuraea diastatica TaxID=1848329 RepID=UPI001FE2E8BC|nr:hypothetical protein [Nonomuraea diastatica]